MTGSDTRPTPSKRNRRWWWPWAAGTAGILVFTGVMGGLVRQKQTPASAAQAPSPPSSPPVAGAARPDALQPPATEGLAPSASWYGREHGDFHEYAEHGWYGEEGHEYDEEGHERKDEHGSRRPSASVQAPGVRLAQPGAVPDVVSRPS